MRKVERGTIAGLVIAPIAILAGLFLEGGHLRQVLQPTAALIVAGGTLGAVLVQFSFRTVRAATLRLRDALCSEAPPLRPRTDQLVRLALQARRHGLVSLDPELPKIHDSFFRKSLMLAIDGVSGRELRDIMELEKLRMEEEEEEAARVLEAAGGFAPTVGILGAVLGLIQVMERLDNIGEIGRGIAVAFVATLYGVGLANLLLLPLAGKLRQRGREAQLLRETTLEGVLSMIEGTSPRALREKLGAPAHVERMVVAR